MVELEFIEPSGARRTVPAEDGQSLMRAARAAGVEGIIGECGGCLTCGTCHVYVDDAQMTILHPPEADEREMIATLLSARHNSRLACQLRASSRFAGLLLTVPPNQG